MDIMALPAPWRKKLVPATYRGAGFHVESGSKENGRRIVEHEFPKREVPYAEDMGRRAFRFSVRAYCIAYPVFRSQLLQPDYTVPRNRLLSVLEQIGSGSLQLPLLPPMTVVVERYRMTEEEKYGGYCVFDIQFAEAGSASAGTANAGGQLSAASQAMSSQVSSMLGRG